jgi:hypothetical protein
MVMEISVEVSAPTPVQRGVEVASTDVRLMRASVGGPLFALWMRGSTFASCRECFVLSPLQCRRVAAVLDSRRRLGLKTTLV